MLHVYSLTFNTASSIIIYPISRRGCHAASESVADDLAAQEIGTVVKSESAVHSTASVQDNRPTSIAVGSAACIFLACVFTLLVMLDVASLGTHLSVMRRNLAHRFNCMKKKAYRAKP